MNPLLQSQELPDQAAGNRLDVIELEHQPMRHVLFEQGPHLIGKRLFLVASAVVAVRPHEQPIRSALDVEIPPTRKAKLNHRHCSIH